MKYGHFDNTKREYVINNPQTPFPWINYLGNKDFFSLVSNTGGGYSFYKDARLRRISRYRYNSIPIDDGGKYFYINEEGKIWSPGWKPVKTTLDSYECRHGMGYTQITSSLNKLEAKLLMFVPVNDNCEILKLTLKNNSAETKEFSLFSFVEFNLWNAFDDMTNFQRNLSTGEVEVKGSTIYHKTEYKERRNHYAFYHVNSIIHGFDTDRETFTGLYNGLNAPQTVVENWAHDSIAHGWSPIASHHLNIKLSAGQSKDFVFILGYVENPENEKWESKGVINKKPALELIEKFNTTEKTKIAFDELQQHWNSLLNNFQVQTPSIEVDTMVNTWNQYQCIVTYNMSRSASYFESGIGRGMGFRDSNQDLIGVVHQIPEKAKQRILDIAATQFPDGGAYHQYQPLTKRGNNEVGGNFNDDPLWLILSVTAYIKETGDYSILNEEVPFNNDENNKASLLEHLKRSFSHVTNNLGPHGLPLIGRADWNDCLNLNCFSNNPDESFQTTENQSGGKAESLMIAGLFVLYGKEFVKLAQQINEPQIAESALEEIEKMEKAVLQHGWDGEWFLRAYDFYGNKIGSNENEEGKIFIESQGFCVMAGIGMNDGKAAKALASVKQHLDCEYGLVLQQPAFTKYHINMGEISTYPAGYKENAGIFCHNNPWIMIGETLLGNGNRAYEYYKKIAPAFLQEISDLHKTEPYVYSQMIAGKDAFKPGEAKNSWLTGTAAWNFYAISQFILGIKPDYNGLLIEPCIPSEWAGFKVNRTFRGVHYNITVENPNRVSCGVKELYVEGKLMEKNIVPIFEKGTFINVKLVLG